MSIIPNEIETMKEAIETVKGNVLVYGLGLGYFPYMISLKNDVNKITIIEKEDILFEEYKVINGTIKTKQKVTAGRWYGTFNFNISTNVKESNVS